MSEAWAVSPVSEFQCSPDELLRLLWIDQKRAEADARYLQPSVQLYCLHATTQSARPTEHDPPKPRA